MDGGRWGRERKPPWKIHATVIFISLLFLARSSSAYASAMLFDLADNDDDSVACENIITF